MPRAFIVDPSLKDLRGHHYMMTMTATESAARRGFDVHWLCSAEFDARLKPASAVITPTFRTNLYTNYMASARAEPKSGLARVANLWKPFRPRTADIAPATNKVSVFKEDFARAAARLSIGPADRIFMHTADGISYLAISEILESAGEAAPIFHVATPYDPVGVMPNRDSADEVANAIARLQQIGLIDKKLFLFAENTFLAQHLTDLWSATVRPLCPPTRLPTQQQFDAGRAFRKALCSNEDALLAVTLGSARIEKGFHLLPEIVGCTLELAEAAALRIQFAIQASPQIIGRLPAITEALKALEQIDSSHVSLLLDPLSEQEYESLLYASDVVLMPYLQREYRVRGSGVASEAVVAGKILTATADTFPGHMAKASGGELGRTPKEFADALIRIARDREQYFANAARASIDYCSRYTSDAYWGACLEAELNGSANAGCAENADIDYSDSVEEDCAKESLSE